MLRYFGHDSIVERSGRACHGREVVISLGMLLYHGALPQAILLRLLSNTSLEKSFAIFVVGGTTLFSRG